MITKQCKYCNSTFDTVHASKIICSNVECKAKYHHEKSFINSTCPICKTTFEHRKCIKKIYCSKLCAQHSPDVIQKMVKSQKTTYLDKYGTKHPMQTDATKAAFKATMLKKYGVEHALQSNDIMQSKINTTHAKYGVDNVFELDSIKEVSKDTKIKKYGDENYRNDDKRKLTTLGKYGVAHYSKSKDFKNKLFKNTYNKIIEKFIKTFIIFDSGEFVGLNKIYNFKCKKCGNTFQYNLSSTNFPTCRVCNPISDAVKQTKKIKYGNENYNNTEQAQSTSLKKYGETHYNKTEQYKMRINDKTYENITSNKKFSNILPAFSREEFDGVTTQWYYNFICKTCGQTFESYLCNGHIPICRNCNAIIKSKMELEVIEYIKSIYFGEGEIVHNDRKILGGQEIDIFLPELKFAIEFDGLYFHSEISGRKDKNYHLNKTNMCASKGIKLIHIFENEWLYKTDIVKSIIYNYFKKNDNKIFGRKCEIRLVSSADKDAFLNENHMQGADRSRIRIGLYYNNELVSIMTFSSSRYDVDSQYEIHRYVNKKFYSIIGGASKLFNYFLKNYSPASIVTYSDKRYFNGDIYTTLGFEHVGDTAPNYFYIDKRILKSRIQFQKHKLKNILNVYDAAQSEWQNMKNNGFDRIWDCGNLKFIWKKQ